MAIKIETLYPMADVLCMTLKLSGTSKNKVCGEVTKTIDFPELGTDLLFSLIAQSSWVDIAGEEIGVLFSVRGNLMVYVVSDVQTYEFELYVIDREKLSGKSTVDLFEKAGVDTTEGAMDLLKDAVVHGYYKGHQDAKWSDMKSA